MPNRTRFITAVCACLVIVSLSLGAASAATVTINVSAKSGISDTKTLNVTPVRARNDQLAVSVQSTLLTPQQLVIKFIELKHPIYDVYVNGDFLGQKCAEDLNAGIQWTIPGTVADQAAMRCLRALDPKVAEVYKSVHARSGAEPWRAAYTLGQADEWVKTGIRVEQAYRSVAITLAPANEPLDHIISAAYKHQRDNVNKTVLNCCELLQKARSQMYKVLTDAELRNEVVGAMTPVKLTASCFIKNGRRAVTAAVKNDCDLPVSGKISVVLPKGWKTVGAKLNIGKLASGKSYTTTFSIAQTSKNAPAPKTLSFAAVVDIVRDDFGSRLWLHAAPVCPKP